MKRVKNYDKLKLMGFVLALMVISYFIGCFATAGNAYRHYPAYYEPIIKEACEELGGEYLHIEPGCEHQPTVYACKNVTDYKDYLFWVDKW